MIAANLRDLRIGVFAYLALLAIELVLQASAYPISFQAERLTSGYGWGNVPADESAMVEWVTDNFDSAVLIVLCLQLAVLMWVLIGAGRALRALGIAQALAPWFTGVSLLVPILCLYRPWQGIGETRTTFEAALEAGALPEKAAERGVGAETFVFGAAFLLYNLGGAVLAPTADSDKVEDLATAHAFFRAFRMGALVNAGFVVPFAIIAAWYWTSFLALYRRTIAMPAKPDAAPQPSSAATSMPLPQR